MRGLSCPAAGDCVRDTGRLFPEELPLRSQQRGREGGFPLLHVLTNTGLSPAVLAGGTWVPPGLTCVAPEPTVSRASPSRVLVSSAPRVGAVCLSGLTVSPSAQTQREEGTESCAAPLS